ncbi:hypothetical protein WJX81_008698 [Elliptochloris bilobata]|uniref:Uncharacterized protein n=1 Tax=Elliptochloris bilobata TaxID=381761 RepID=A0AAW1R336_9CHLO
MLGHYARDCPKKRCTSGGPPSTSGGRVGRPMGMDPAPPLLGGMDGSFDVLTPDLHPNPAALGMGGTFGVGGMLARRSGPMGDLAGPVQGALGGAMGPPLGRPPGSLGLEGMPQRSPFPGMGGLGGRGGGGQRGHALPGGGPGGGGHTWISRGGSLATGPVRGEANDYSQHFVDTGLRPQNNLRDVHISDRFEEYPKMRELVIRKDQLVAQRATPPFYLKADLRTLKLSAETLGTRFDVALVDPPWEEYARRAPGLAQMDTWGWAEIQALELENVMDTPSFIFLWCGSAEGLDAGRHCLRKWGFRRCEDICWIKTNVSAERKGALRPDAHSVLQHTKEHCLMGIRGTVRRAHDGHIIHSNVDTDVIVSEEPPAGSTRKPEEIYGIIERFSQGRRRLELFGEDHNIRPGWFTIGRDLSGSNFSPQVYASLFVKPDGMPGISNGSARPMPGAPTLLGTTPEIEELRPRSPPK